MLEFLLNTDKKTGLSTGKLEKEFACDKLQVSNKSLKDIIEYLLVNNTGKDENIIEAQCFVYTCRLSSIYAAQKRSKGRIKC